MNRKLESVQNKFLESIGRISDAFGLNGFVAKLFGILYLNAKPLSLNELAEALGVTKGNVSINIRELEKWGAVKKVWIRGSRKDYYEAEIDIKKVILNKARASVGKRISEISDVIKESNKIIESTSGELTGEELKVAKGYKERLKKIEELKEFISHALGLAEKFL